MRYVSKPVEVDVVEITDDYDSVNRQLIELNALFTVDYIGEDVSHTVFTIFHDGRRVRPNLGDVVLFYPTGRMSILTPEELQRSFKPVSEVPNLFLVPKRLEDWLSKRSPGEPAFQVRRKETSYHFDYRYRKMDEPK